MIKRVVLALLGSVNVIAAFAALFGGGYDSLWLCLLDALLKAMGGAACFILLYVVIRVDENESRFENLNEELIRLHRRLEELEKQE